MGADGSLNHEEFVTNMGSLLFGDSFQHSLLSLASQAHIHYDVRKLHTEAEVTKKKLGNLEDAVTKNNATKIQEERLVKIENKLSNIENAMTKIQEAVSKLADT